MTKADEKGREIIISPFSNSLVRDWPSTSYSALIQLLLNRFPDVICHVIGTSSQTLRANEIVRNLDSTRVFNDCGVHAWRVIDTALREAACVIGNNSGIAHLSSRYAAPTVCIFGGSHQRAEWRPIGPNVTIISQSIWCSPCHLDRLSRCPFNKACLREIKPHAVAAAVFDILEAHQPTRSPS